MGLFRQSVAEARALVETLDQVAAKTDSMAKDAVAAADAYGAAAAAWGGMTGAPEGMVYDPAFGFVPASEAPTGGLSSGEGGGGSGGIQRGDMSGGRRPGSTSSPGGSTGGGRHTGLYAPGRGASQSGGNQFGVPITQGGGKSLQADDATIETRDILRRIEARNRDDRGAELKRKGLL